MPAELVAHWHENYCRDKTGNQGACNRDNSCKGDVKIFFRKDYGKPLETLTTNDDGDWTREIFHNSWSDFLDKLPAHPTKNRFELLKQWMLA